MCTGAPADGAPSFIESKFMKNISFLFKLVKKLKLDDIKLGQTWMSIQQLGTDSTGQLLDYYKIK